MRRWSEYDVRDGAEGRLRRWDSGGLRRQTGDVDAPRDGEGATRDTENRQ